MAGFKKKAQAAQPEGAIRRSQLVMTYGPGAMVDLIDSAVLVGGLDFWSYDKKKGVPHVSEPRLRESLAERFKIAGRDLSIDRPFREPPPVDDREPSRFAGIQVLEFPQWFVCQNPACRTLTRKHDGLELKKGRYWHACGQSRSFECVPVRFLGACRRGHVQEWPWIAFAHLANGGRCEGTTELRLEEGATGDFAEIRVVCKCGKSQALASASGGVKLTCDGKRPWLGTEGNDTCENELRLLVRTASNSYFSQMVSALSIPEPARALDDAIGEHWNTLKVATPETLPAFRTIPGLKDAIAKFTDDDVLRAVRARQKGVTGAARMPLRSAEFKQLEGQPKEQPGERPPDGERFFAREARIRGELPQGVRRIVLASKLREVRVQIGFTRLEPSTPDLQGEYDLAVESAPLGLTTNWLPATELHGEGVFVQLREDAVREWEERDAVKRRADELVAGYEGWLRSLSTAAREKAPPFPGVRFYMLHSLSHLLISAISLECGYSASAIRERIYCGPSAADTSTPMAAILLMTGTPGTEGTLGGLVEQGRKIRQHLQRAYDLGRLCSNDPICAGHSPSDDPAERWLEGAGCHGCMFIAECSCERFNRYLDRALVVPTVGRVSGADAALAFFGARP